MNRLHFYVKYKFLFIFILSITSSSLYAKNFLIDHTWKDYNRQNELVRHGIILDVDVQFYNNKAYMSHDRVDRRVLERDHPETLEAFFSNLAKNGGTVSLEVKSSQIEHYQYVIDMAKSMGVNKQVIYGISSGESGASDLTHKRIIDKVSSRCSDCKIAYWAFNKEALSQLIRELEQDNSQHNIMMMGGASHLFNNNDYSKRIRNLGIKVLQGLWDRDHKQEHNVNGKYSDFDYTVYITGDTLAYMQDYREYFKPFSIQNSVTTNQVRRVVTPQVERVVTPQVENKKSEKFEAENSYQTTHAPIKTLSKASNGKYRLLQKANSTVQFHLDIKSNTLYNLTLNVRSGNKAGKTFYLDVNAYQLFVDGEEVSTLIERNSIREEKLSSNQWKWYWGKIHADDIFLTKGKHTITIKAVDLWKGSNVWCAVDYLSIEQ